MAQHSSGAPIAIQRVTPQQAGRLELACEAIGADGAIADLYSAYHDNVSPPLAWTGLPDAETFALILEGPDAPTERPFLHWMVWNIPGTLQALPAGLPGDPALKAFGSLIQGRNSLGQFGYMGPKPPPGDGPHRYHLQLFALDLTLDLKPSASLDELVEVLQANTIASAELVGTYAESDGVQPVAEPSQRSFATGDAGRGGLDEDDADRHAPHDDEGVVRPGA